MANEKVISVAKLQNGDFRIEGITDGALFDKVKTAVEGRVSKSERLKDVIFCSDNPIQTLMSMENDLSGWNLNFDPALLTQTQAQQPPQQQAASEAVEKEKGMTEITVVEKNGKFYVNGLNTKEENGVVTASKWGQAIIAAYDGELNKQKNITCKVNPMPYFEELEKSGSLAKFNAKVEFSVAGAKVEKEAEKTPAAATPAKEPQKAEAGLDVFVRESKKGEKFVVVTGTKFEDKVLQKHLHDAYGGKYNKDFKSWALSKADASDIEAIKKDLLEVHRTGVIPKKEETTAAQEQTAAPKKEKEVTEITVVEKNGKFYANGLNLVEKQGELVLSKWAQAIVDKFGGEPNNSSKDPMKVNITCKTNPMPYFNELEKSGALAKFNAKVEFSVVGAKVAQGASAGKPQVDTPTLMEYQINITPSTNEGRVFVSCEAMKDFSELRKEFKNTFSPEGKFNKEKGYEVAATERQVTLWLQDTGAELLKKQASLTCQAAGQAQQSQGQSMSHS